MHQVHGRVADEGKIPIFFPCVLPLVMCSPTSPSSGVGVQLRWAKAWPCHGGCPGEVNVVAGRLQLAGRGGGGPRTPTSGGVVAVAAVPEIGGAPPRCCYGHGEQVEGAPGALNASGHGDSGLGCGGASVTVPRGRKQGYGDLLAH